MAHIKWLINFDVDDMCYFWLCNFWRMYVLKTTIILNVSDSILQLWVKFVCSTFRSNAAYFCRVFSTLKLSIHVANITDVVKSVNSRNISLSNHSDYSSFFASTRIFFTILGLKLFNYLFVNGEVRNRNKYFSTLKKQYVIRMPKSDKS
jgi:hypothetical protein